MFVNGFDPELPSLAASAAIELDLRINGEPAGFDAVHRLGQRLHEALNQPAGSQAARLQVDTELETILAEAFVRSGDDPATILSDLFRRTAEISGELRSMTSEIDRRSLERQRAFCLAFSQALAAYRQMLWSFAGANC